MADMERTLLCLSLSLIAGLMLSRVAKKIHLPAVTAYLVAGLLLGPFLLGSLGVPDVGFSSLEEIEDLTVVSNVALGFIAFTLGNEFRLSQLRQMGRQATVVGILQAVVTTLLVDAVLVGVHLLLPDLLSFPAAITLGAIAAATAPAATLMVVRQYKADGPLTRLLLLVVAIDDAVGLILFSASYGIAHALETGVVHVATVVIEPVFEITASLLLGLAAGFVLNWSELHFHSRGNRMSVTVAFVLLTVGLSMIEFDIGEVHCGFSLLLVCMMTGTVFCNICDTSKELMERLDRWTTPLSILFFVLSGAELDLDILRDPLVLLVGLVYILSRAAGKIIGAYLSCAATGCSKNIQRHLGITLLPQAGVALGMTLTASTLQSGALIRNVVLFGVLVYEMVGPILTKRSLTLAGEINQGELASADAAEAAETAQRLQTHREKKRNSRRRAG